MFPPTHWGVVSTTLLYNSPNIFPIRSFQPRKVFSGEVDHNGTSRLLELIDTPGFGDPDKSDAQTIRELSRATVDIVAGVDLFVHVVKKDRMGYIDRFLPEIILSGLADDDEAQKEIARRYVFVVTHADSARQPVEQASLDEFKGAMKLAGGFECFHFYFPSHLRYPGIADH